MKSLESSSSRIGSMQLMYTVGVHNIEGYGNRVVLLEHRYLDSGRVIIGSLSSSVLNYGLLASLFQGSYHGCRHL